MNKVEASPGRQAYIPMHAEEPSPGNSLEPGTQHGELILAVISSDAVTTAQPKAKRATSTRVALGR